MKYTILLALACTIVLANETSYAEMLSIKGDNVNLRSGPGRNYQTNWEYDNGMPLKVIEKRNKWVAVEDFEGDTGWIYQDLLVDTPHLVVKANKHNRAQTINVRQAPNTSAPIIGHAQYGVVFETLTRQDNWVRVRHSEEGVEGWVSRSLLWGY